MQLSLIYFDFKIGNTLKAKSNALKILKNCVCATDQSNVFSEIGVGKYILVFVIIIWKKKKKKRGWNSNNEDNFQKLWRNFVIYGKDRHEARIAQQTNTY